MRTPRTPNRVFERSGVATKFRLAHAVEIAYRQSPADMVEDLCRATALGRTWPPYLAPCAAGGATRPEALDELHELRDRYQADLVALAVALGTEGTAGITWIAPNDGDSACSPQRPSSQVDTSSRTKPSTTSGGGGGGDTIVGIVAGPWSGRGA